MLSNYTIKQALPRLVVAAIAINLSYWICAILVDASNLLGQNLIKVLMAVQSSALDSTSLIAIMGAALAPSAVIVGGGVAVAGVAAVAGMAGALPTLALGIAMMFASVFLGIAAAVLTALLILAGRQALIIVLVVVSPIAFALYILPGTKSLFDRWRKLLTTMLVFFPLFSLLYGGAQVAAGILIAASGSGADPKVAGIFLLMGLIAQFAPLFFSPWLLKNSSGFLGQLGDRLQRATKPLTSMPGRAGRKRLARAGETTKNWGKMQLGEAAARYQKKAKQAEADAKDGKKVGRFTGRRRAGLLGALAHGSERNDRLNDYYKARSGELGAEDSQNNARQQELHNLAESAKVGKEIIDQEHKEEHMANNQALYDRQAVARDTLARTQAQRKQRETEFQTEASVKAIDDELTALNREERAGVTADRAAEIARKRSTLNQERDTARALSTVHAQTQTAQNATAGAERIKTTEGAHRVLNSDNEAAKAGGRLDPLGAQRARATADNILERQLMDDAKIERSSIGSLSDAQVYTRATKGLDEQGNKISVAAQVAAAGEIASRGYAQNHIDTYRSLNEQLYDAALDRGYYDKARAEVVREANMSDEDYVAAIEAHVDQSLIKDSDLDGLRYSQKQFMAEIGDDAPFSMSEGARGAMGRGLSRTNVDRDWAYRLTKKLKAPAIQRFKAEDMKWIEDGFASGQLTEDLHGAAIQEGIMDILRSPDATANTKKEIKDFANRLRAQGRISVSFDNYEQVMAAKSAAGGGSP